MTIQYSPAEVTQITTESRFDFHPQGRLLLFVGHAHSGHSLVGALLDAHPEVCLANEVNVVKLVQEQKLESKAIERVLHHAYLNNPSGWKNSAYYYNLKNGSQGHCENPIVMGDKKAGGTTRIIHNHPEVLHHLLSCYGERLRFLFVERNPLDIVAAYSHYMKQPPSAFHVNRYNENLKTVKWIEGQVANDQWLTIKQDTFVHHPYDEIIKVFDYLGVDVSGHEPSIKDWVSVVRSDIPGKSAAITIPDSLQRQIIQP